MKKVIMLVFILAIGVFNIVGCGVKTNKNAGLDTDGAVSDIPVNNTDMDGQITSECSGSEVPTEENQSNFGKGYC